MDLYTLALSIDPSGVVRGTVQGSAALDAFGEHAEKASRKVEASSKLSSSAFLRLGSMTERLHGSFESLLAITGAGFIGEKLIEETIGAQNAMAQLSVAVTSTGGAARLSAKELGAYAEELQAQTTYTDDAIMSAESLLLTFTKIRGDTFKDATVAVANLAARMGGDLQGAAVQVGKALQDPNEGLTALRRSGVSFSESQQQVIKDLFNTGHVAQAQGMILRELNTEFGGAAAAARDTLGGALKGLWHDFADLFKATKDQTSSIAGFLNATGEAIRGIKDHRAELHELIVVLGSVAVVYGVVTAAQALMAASSASIFLFSIRAAFAAAAEAGTGFAGVLIGLRPLVMSGATWASMSSVVTGIGAAFTTAAAEGTGFAGVMAGLEVALAPVLAVLAPLALALAGVLAVYVTYKSAIDDANAADAEADARDQDRIRRLVARAAAREKHRKEAEQSAADARQHAAEEAAAIAKVAGARQEEVNKLAALNKAYGANEVQLKLITNAYDANIQKAKDAADHKGVELAALNRVTDALRAQKDQEALNAADKTIMDKTLADIKASNEKVEQLRTEVDEAQRLYDATTKGQGAIDALNVTLAGEHAAHELLGKAMPKAIDDARKLAEQKERLAQSTQKVVDAQKQLNDEIKAEGDAVVEQIRKDQERWKEEGRQFAEALKQMQGHFASFLSDIFTKGISSFGDLFKHIKDMFLTMIADMLAASFVKKIAAVVAGLMGNLIPATATGQDGKPVPRSSIPGLGSGGTKMLGAGLAGFGIGFASQNAGIGILGGAASGFAVAGPAGAAAGALAGFVGGLIGSNQAAREAAHQQDLLRKAYANTQLQIQSMLSGNNLDVSIAQAQAQFDQYREMAKQAAGAGVDFLTKMLGQGFADKTFGTSVNNIAYQQNLLNQQEQQYIDKLREEAALKQKQSYEDLQVRLLAAQGHQDEADALALQFAQQREYAQYVKDGADPATLALLQQVQAQEKLADATKQASSAALNMVSGYRLQAAIFNAMGAGGFSAAPLPTFSVPATRSSDTASGDLVVPVQLDSQTIGTAVLKNFRQRAAQQLSNSTRWSEIQK